MLEYLSDGGKGKTSITNPPCDQIDYSVDLGFDFCHLDLDLRRPDLTGMH